MQKSSVVAGLILIAAGAFFLLLSLFPNVTDFLNIETHWPFIIVAVGGLFLFGAMLGTPALAVPGTIIAGIGLMLYYQNVNNAWGSWAYSWALIPGFVGLGTIFMYTLQGRFRQGLNEGGRLIIISLVLFFVFGAFLGGNFASSLVWAILLIGLGLLLMVRNVFGAGRDR